MPATPPPSAAYRPRQPPSPDREQRRRLLLGAAVVIAGAALVAVVAGQARVDARRSQEVRRVLDAMSALCGLAVFALCRGTWRQIGDRAALWVGAAALSFGVGVAARPELVTALLGDAAPATDWLLAVSAAGAALTPVLFAAGLFPALSRRRLSPAAVAGTAVAGLAVLTLVMRWVPGVDSAFTVAQLTRADGPGAVGAGLLVGGAWLALGTAYTLRGFGQRWLYGWSGLMLFALTLSGLAAGAAGPGDGWLVGAAVLEAVGALLALAGCYLDLLRVYEDQTLRLSDSEIDAQAAGARERVRAASLRTQRHDLINAITAIDGAATILEREFDQLSARDRATLAHVLGSGTARLRRQLSDDGAKAAAVSMAEAAATVAGDPTWPGQVQVDVAADLLATGSAGETAEAVRRLVDYAYRRAPDDVVSVSGERDGEWVVLRVEDRGPTMPREMRRVVIDPDAHRLPGQDDSLGLRVAARLMREQGGDLWVEARSGGGTSYGICLPAHTAPDEEAAAER